MGTGPGKMRRNCSSVDRNKFRLSVASKMRLSRKALSFKRKNTKIRLLKKVLFVQKSQFSPSKKKISISRKFFLHLFSVHFVKKHLIGITDKSWRNFMLNAT